jgi:hypothetical protein
VALAAFVVFVLFLALVLPRQAVQAEQVAGDVGSPDSAFWYTPAELYRMAEAYGPAGRRTYVRARWTFDVVWPLVYTVFLSSSIGWVYRRAFSLENPWRLANLAPVLGACLDYLENTATSLVMVRYPALTPGVAHLAPVFTLTKWIFVNSSFGLLALGVGMALWRWIRRARSRD